MINAKVTVTKKRPASVELSSDAFSATLEIELPDAVFINGNGDLRQTLAKLFKEVNAEVDSQIINGNGHEEPLCNPPEPIQDTERLPAPIDPTKKAPSSRLRAPRKPAGGNGSCDGKMEAASNRQINYLIGLATREAKMSLPELRAFVQRQVRKEDLYALTKAEASAVIESLKNGK